MKRETGRQPIYYESHITIEPVFDKKLAEARRIVGPYGFRIAELLMQKRREDSPERSQYDTFATGRGPEYEKLFSRMNDCTKSLVDAGYSVWRRKIEAVLFDERSEA